ncbi:hypothetical protein Belba_2077 [Belliella baltica DSM 15883]|uniref:Deoxyribose-phosphate aldolase n=1 Tax=Belliella baltica (strain DSM 15883 / CIP 108006 / LMG 21964 / BA134) TaxID=866536 RepID=I3Z5X7_BELBD|nr:DUF6503 family protein [Belliella baltica]AFL84645.1 hypothetical protein Belba_2077 [Belliella baltica DSM 15883]
MKYALIYLLGAFLLFSCDPKSEAEKIIDQSIAAHGGTKFESSRISFDFRDRSYQIFKSPSAYEYIRSFSDSTGQVKDVLNNSGFTRFVNEEKVELEEKREKAFTNSVNSVAYFAYLPYGLNDPAVFKNLVGETEMDGNKYHVIKVTFSEEGGGEDFDDEFLYWINQETFLVDYLAYSYHTDGGGVRFRKAIKKHEIGGLILQDYENYKPADETVPVEEMEALYKAGELELLSEILLENVVVE